ncbi:unnamed protein product [Kuraishia capsulata CBS 1993]|uniref:RecA family profile 1 domain-containing protein n=1 Tax=Kuraishia capsulata CBS 1993 TaxID=1382522 RepID=W6MJ86_9ASCO|nr:uncharacterized protein KUCA_T00002287001 [Kuraishia capsulata CBS 1993]CDK26316.1 unnamed protein product [Kuraishia capsulata CBS 1993]
MDLYQQCSYSEVLFDKQFEQILGAFQRQAISTVEILACPAADLAKKVGRSAAEVSRLQRSLRQDISQKLKVRSISVDDEFFTTGDSGMDLALGGNGISLGHLTEVSGESATGKSQVLMQLAVSVQLPREMNGLGPSLAEGTRNNAQVVYVSTEGILETRRLDKVCTHFTEVLKENGVHDPMAFPTTDNVLQTMCSDLESQQHVLNVQLPVLLEQKQGKIKLVIVDSIAHHIRAEMDTSKSYTDYLQRQFLIVKLAKNLRELALKYNFACVVSNQVSDKPFDSALMTSSKDHLPLQFEYQLGWLSGWDSKAIWHRQRGDTVEVDGETSEPLNSQDPKLNVAEPAEVTAEDEMAPSSLPPQLTLTQRLKLESRSEMFAENSYHYDYKIPTMGIQWTNLLDVRVVLSKRHKPIIGSNLIDDYAEDLGIIAPQPPSNGSQDEPQSQSQSQTQTQDRSLTEILSNHEYLNNYNWEVQRKMRMVFSPFVETGLERECQYEVWNGGVRSKES